MNQKNNIVLVKIFKTAMLRSNLRDYADAYISVTGTITIAGAGDDDVARQADERDKGIILKIVLHLLNA